MIIPGTNPTHCFTLPVDASLVAEARVVYWQGSREVLRREGKDFRRDGTSLITELSQDETLLFDSGPVAFQLSVRLVDGRVLRSGIMFRNAAEVLDREVL